MSIQAPPAGSEHTGGPAGPDPIPEPPPPGTTPEALETIPEAPEPSPEKEKAWREWMMLGVGWTALLSLIALIIALSALSSTNPTTTVVAGQGAANGGSPAAGAGKPEAVKLLIKADTEHGKLGPDGKWHDAFLPANFTIHPGRAVTVTVYNYDTMPHSFTSSTLSASSLVNQEIPSGSAGSPSKTTFTFKAPSTPGRYAWWCAIPCDPFAMAHVGYMRGYVTVAA